MLTKRPLPQFSLRSAFATVTIAAIASATVSYFYRRDRLELSAVRAAARLDGQAQWEEQHSFWFLPGSRRCTKLTFMKCDLAGKDMSFVADLPQLRRLYMSGSSVTDSHMRTIGRLRSLEFLNVGGSLVTDEGLSLLEECCRLKQLRFARTAVKGTSFETLARLPMLEDVVADSCPIDDDAMKWLGRCRRLRVIVASSRSITNRGVRALCAARGLEEVQLAGDVTPQGAEPLFALPHLKHLNVSGRDGFWEKWHRISDDVWQRSWPQTKARPEGERGRSTFKK